MNWRPAGYLAECVPLGERMDSAFPIHLLHQLVYRDACGDGRKLSITRRRNTVKIVLKMQDNWDVIKLAEAARLPASEWSFELRLPSSYTYSVCIREMMYIVHTYIRGMDGTRTWIDGPV